MKNYVVVENSPGESVKTTSETYQSQTAPDITVYDKNRNAVTLSSLKGKAVIVNFWADWCGPCLNELPTFQKLYEEYKDDVVFLMINIDSIPEHITVFAEKQGYNFPIYYDLDHSAFYTYSSGSIPVTIAVDKDGCLADKRIGVVSEDTLLQFIKQVKE